MAKGSPAEDRGWCWRRCRPRLARRRFSRGWPDSGSVTARSRHAFKSRCCLPMSAPSAPRFCQHAPQLYREIVVRITTAWLRQAPFRHNPAPSGSPHWNEEPFHAVRPVYRLIGFSWMRCGDAGTNHDHVCHPGTHDHLRDPSTERGLSDHDICAPTNSAVSLVVLALIRSGRPGMRDCLILIILVSVAGCSSTRPPKETPPASQTSPMPLPTDPKSLLHVP